MFENFQIIIRLLLKCGVSCGLTVVEAVFSATAIANLSFYTSDKNAASIKVIVATSEEYL